MTVTPAEQALQHGLWRLDQGVVFRADRAFLSTLTLGQVIKGKVLRHYEGGRYAMSFGGEERVVDSAIPLRSGEIVHGRVVGLDDQVHLERVPAPAAERPADGGAGPAELPAAADEIERLFARHRAALGPADHALIRTVGRSQGDVSLAASAALVLRKIGLPLQVTLLRAVMRAVADRAGVERAIFGEHATALAIDPQQRAAGSQPAVQGLSRVLADLRVPEGPPDAPADGAGDQASDAALRQATDAGRGSADRGRDKRRGEWLLGRRVLNTQTESAVTHRFLTLPLWFGDRLLEIDLALFAETKVSRADDGVRLRRIVLSLDLAPLGRVDAVLAVANRRLRIAFETRSEATTELLGGRLGRLESDLAARDWSLDELVVETRTDGAPGGAARAVVAHYVTQDSLSRLL
jgi:hypothetical protein